METNSILNKAPSDCCGCASCRDICPKGSISMKPDAEGFYYPVIDLATCVNCGICKKKCPTEPQNLKESYVILGTFCGRYSDQHEIKHVSSGGLCDAAANAFLEEGGIVYGAGYSNDYHNVIVKRIAGKQDAEQIRGSKYVQTIKPDGLYKNIKRDLWNGLSVLYIGLPCDVAAVKNHVGNVDNLTTIEIICSGVPSPEVHRQFVSYIEDRSNQKITGFTYRKKQHGWHWPYVEAKCGDKVLYNKSWSAMELGYAFHALIRPSCYNCKFKSDNNLADITAGDFWGLKKSDPRYHRDGVSAIIVHTIKGIELINKLKRFKIQRTTYQEILAGNPRLNSCPKTGVNRQNFSNQFIHKGLIRAYKDSLTIKDRIKNVVMIIYSILNHR